MGFIELKSTAALWRTRLRLSSLSAENYMPGGPLEHTVDKETLERIQSAYTEVNKLLNIKFKTLKRRLHHSRKRLYYFKLTYTF